MDKQEIQISRFGSVSLASQLGSQLVRVRPRVLGIASAFVTVRGMQEIMCLARRAGVQSSRLLAGISNAVTHPEALVAAIDAGWDIRLGASPDGQGIFHPKLIIAGESFDASDKLRSPSLAYIGSSNITYGGLRTNIECGLVATGNACPPGLTDAFAELWQESTPATNEFLRQYAEYFAARNRQRSVEDIEALGISDSMESDIHSYVALRGVRRRSSQAAIPTMAARAAWTGLESFTGEYRYQVEFPRAAGTVLRELLSVSSGASTIVPVFCTADSQIREMKYRFYDDNSMFRLNIPNDMPGVERSRRERNGIALVEAAISSSAQIQLTILPPGEDTDRAVRRSVTLGTWGQTPTRLYGWY